MDQYVTRQEFDEHKNEVLNGLDKILNKLEKVEQEQVFTHRSLERLEVKVDKLETKVDKLEIKVDRLDGEQELTRNLLLKMDDRLTSIEKKLT